MANRLVYRTYIQKDDENPVWNVWVEVTNHDREDPKISIYCNGKDGKEHILTLSMASALRLERTIAEIIDSLAPLHDKEWEEIEEE